MGLKADARSKDIPQAFRYQLLTQYDTTYKI